MDKKMIRSLAIEGKAIIGTERIFKELRRNTLAEVIAASNCSPEALKEARRLCIAAGKPLEVVDLTAADFGIMCKKPFPIALLGIPHA